MYIKINFIKSKKVIETFLGATLLSIAKEHGIPIPSPCGGNGLCGGCRVRVIEGNDKEDISAEEYDRLTDEQIADNYRLACSYIPYNDITVEA